MPDPITTQDLYGETPSPPVAPEPPATPAPAQIPVEETPEIPMDMTPVEPQSQVPPPPPMPNVSGGSTVMTIAIFIILFIAGILLSSYIRPFITGVNNNLPKTSTPTARSTPSVATPTPADPFAGWQALTIAGVSYKLPPDVSSPTCDSTGCVSQGTNLPGGTRFTLATRGGSSAFVTDANGVAFVNKEATVSGHVATEFFGTFAGRTSGGYGFTQMHGFMITLTPTLTLEVNHFTPTGVSVDFATDDALFTQIISTLNFSPVPIATTPGAATTSGY